MSKRNNNSGIANLNDIDFDQISGGASLKEENLDVKDSGTIRTELRLPAKFHSILKRNIGDNNITGSMNSYFVEAVRRRMKEEGML